MVVKLGRKKVDRICPPEHYLDDNGVDRLDMLVDPTNLGIERSFGIMKFYEARFINLSFGCLSAMTISKFNNLPKWIDTIGDDELVAAHDSVRMNQSIARASHMIQQDHLRLNTERRMTEVLNYFWNIIDSFFNSFSVL